ncbi:hypothetical protein GJ700_34080 [Duganella sp. FT92W]|uniref:Sn-glycerol-3-phosphate transporter n=1 Tax=Pseudoduganella rivuli TaxID=2666085 RepID=A0A7X2IVA0_9BURK|nr:hypothetical protein [Pseudoduganella rivuli]MRV76751.1 hypothetical protein [Pseudoduganella rivuli]
MPISFRCSLALLAIASTLPAAVLADELFHTIDDKPLSQVWINPGFYSFHFDSGKNLNNSNFGLGAEYRFSTVMSATAGRFYNSDRRYSNYAGVYWQPVAIGPLRLGAVAGAFNGYPRARNGGWFPAVIPAISYEYERVGANIAVIPGYKDRLYGAISVQLKFKLTE